MTRGLVIGKFLPVHKGHIALIEFAASRCDEVIVSMSFTPHDVIEANLRFSWLKEIFKNSSKIKPFMIADDFDDEKLPLIERTGKWAQVLKTIYPPFDFVFSSEEYGEPFAMHLGAKHLSFDPPRKSHAVSATLIRGNPFRYWDFIPDVVRPFFVKKICFYGPESTGKSTMAKRMAEIYNTEFVPEVARELITSNDFTVDDILRIGKAQTERVVEKTKTANKFLFCDTDLITTQIYCRHYLGVIPPELLQWEKEVHYDQYFLFGIDVAWVQDGLRDLGERRKEMYEIFKAELERRSISYIDVKGAFEEREELIKVELDRLF